MQQLDVTLLLKLRANQMLPGTHAVGPEGELAGRGLRQFQQALHGGRVQLGVDDQHIGHQRHRGDRREVLLEVVMQALVDAGGDGVMHGAHQQGVAVGRSLGHVVRAQGRARAGLVFHHHRLAQAFA
ncbi:hypothetical protein D3C73_1356010 [compost metagenome]